MGPQSKRRVDAMIKKVPYIEKLTDVIMGHAFYKQIPLRPTGRWRLVTGPDVEGYRLDIEHQGRFFKRWIHEYEIGWDNEITVTVFKCN